MAPLYHGHKASVRKVRLNKGGYQYATHYYYGTTTVRESVFTFNIVRISDDKEIHSGSVRATSRNEAKTVLRFAYPGVSFYR